MKTSKETQSLGYRFVKSMMEDGASGNDINKFVTSLSADVNEELGGSLLMNLLRNAKDVDATETRLEHWFGPFDYSFFHWAARDWAKYLNDNGLRGTFQFGNDKVWKQWAKQSSKQMTDKEWKKATTSARNQILLFHVWGDAVQHADARAFLDKLYDSMSNYKE